MPEIMEAFTDWADVNEHGIWCPMCGNLLCPTFNYTDDWQEPENCPQCGHPDCFGIDKV